MELIPTKCKTCLLWRLGLAACAALLLLNHFAFAQNTATHTLIIDGIAYDVQIGTERSIKLKNGAEAKIKLVNKEFILFSKDGASFEHPSSMGVASSAEDDGMIQHIGTTALGTLFLVQVHKSTNLSELRELIYEKMIEEPKAKNIPVVRTEFKRTISDGREISGISANYKESSDDNVTLDIATVATDKGEYLMMSMHDNASAPEEKKIIDRFWETLKLQ